MVRTAGLLMVLSPMGDAVKRPGQSSGFPVSVSL